MRNPSIIIKGVMCKEDAVAALQNGADAIWVSNGGKTKTNFHPPTIDVLKNIVSVKSKFPRASVFIDANIMRGTEVLKCLALGADGVFLCRAVMWALQTAGEEGCIEMMTMLNKEFELAMALTHCYKTTEIT
jgi:isopentenyl diphosphate isomerase/L-lactate dehydrogenase-like FMN-dependent dehydrogenase